MTTFRHECVSFLIRAIPTSGESQSRGWSNPCYRRPVFRTMRVPVFRIVRLNPPPFAISSDLRRCFSGAANRRSGRSSLAPDGRDTPSGRCRFCSCRGQSCETGKELRGRHPRQRGHRAIRSRQRTDRVPIVQTFSKKRPARTAVCGLTTGGRQDGRFRQTKPKSALSIFENANSCGK